MNNAIQAYDDAFRIVQEAIFRQDSVTGISFLTRVELYLVQEGRRELLNAVSSW